MSSCRRSRELMELFRYGRPDERSEDQLRHLGGCDACRGEVGCDRQLVRQLQRALEERVVGAAPSPAAWASIRRQAEIQRNEQPAGWFASLVALSRGVGGVTAVSALAVVLIVVGGGGPQSLPADSAAAGLATFPAEAAADVGALLRQVPAERLQAPSRPATAENQIKLVPVPTGKRGSEGQPEEPVAPTNESAIASILERFLQGETAPEIVMAWAAAPAPTPRPGGAPL